GCRRTWLSRSWRAAADAGVGHHAGRCARVRAQCLVGGDLPGAGHPDHGACRQHHGRWAARRPRPEDEAQLTMALLEIRNLSVEFQTSRGPFRAIEDIDITVDRGEVLGVVGESGSGKSVTMLALMGLLPWT